MTEEQLSEFMEDAASLAPRGDWQFALVGPDDTLRGRLREAIAQCLEVLSGWPVRTQTLASDESIVRFRVYFSSEGQRP